MCQALLISGPSVQVAENYIRAVMVPWRSSTPRKRSGLAPAAFVDPCLPSRAEKAPVADGWVHEIKHDGFRLQIHARKEGSGSTP